MAGKRGKRFREAYEQVDRNHHYEPAEAVDAAQEDRRRAASTRPSRSTSASASTSATPTSSCAARSRCRNGTGGDVTVAVFAEGDKAREATEAGAEFVGSDDLAERIEAGWTDFDIVIATPDQMPKVGRLGRILGPQGKMPNPKVGTVTDDVTKAVSETKSGKVEYRTDRQAVIHLSIGKVSFTEQALLENYAAVIDEIVRAKPAASKGRYILSDHPGDHDGPRHPRRHVPHPRGRDPRRAPASIDESDVTESGAVAEGAEVGV